MDGPEPARIPDGAEMYRGGQEAADAIGVDERRQPPRAAAVCAAADKESSIVSTRILGRRTAPIAQFLIPHPRGFVLHGFVGKSRTDENVGRGGQAAVRAQVLEHGLHVGAAAVVHGAPAAGGLQAD